MRKILLLSVFLFSSVANANILFDLSSGYFSTTSSGDVARSNMENHGFLGMSIGGKEQFYVGPNFTFAENDYNATSTTEIGARINYFFNTDKTYKLVLTWSPSVSGTVGSDEIDAWSFLAGLGYELKVNNNFYIGAIIMYHKVSAEKKSNKADVSFNSTTPMISISLRFK
ncbi:MAG: hypothetical protein K2Q18_00525 [Bdellovibrionales bacterium]|nr:hypothetical protein [Bdellovibrionales bacterium]